MPRLAGLLALLVGASLALGVSSASAFLVRNYQSQVGGFSAPAGVSVDPADDAWVTDPGNAGLVTEYSPFPANAKIGEQTGEGEFGCGGAFNQVAAVNATNGELYDADACAVVVHVFDAAGHFETNWTGFGGGFLQLAIDNSATSSAGRVYVSQTSESLVEVFDPTGAEVPFTATAPYIEANKLTGTPTGEGGALVPFSQPWTMAVGPDGDLYVVDRGAGVVDQFEPSGQFVRQITTTPSGPFGSLSAVAVDPTSGNLLIADAGDKVIDEFEPDGTFVGETTGAGSEGALADPQGIAVDSAGHLYVTDGSALKVFGPATFTPLSIDSTSASAISATAGTLETEINPHGVATRFHFEYDTTPYTEGGPAHGTATVTASAGAGVSDAARSAPIQGLAPATTYHFRVVAENELGTVTGPDRAFTTQLAGAAALLPDSRAWELVSPADKHGAPLEPIGEIGPVIQAAGDGSALTYAANGAIGAGGAGNRSTDHSQLLSDRGTAGWSTLDISTPHQAPAGLNAGFRSEYDLFSNDLSLAAVEPFGATPLAPSAGERTPYLRRSDGTFNPLVTAAIVPEGVHFGGEELGPEVFGNGVHFITGTPDLSHVLLESPQPLTEDFQPGSVASPEIYEWADGALQLVSWIPPGSASACGGAAPACVPAGEEGRRSFVGAEDSQARNAISINGSRVVFETVEGPSDSASLFLRDLATGESIALDAAEPGCGSCESGGGDTGYKDASTDGRRIFFTDTHPLTADALGGEPDLYMCQVEETPGGLTCRLTDLTANTVKPSEPANVIGQVIGASEDGSSVYFVAEGALTEGEGAVHGNCLIAEARNPSGRCNLYRYDVATEATNLVAVLSGADFLDWGGVRNLAELTARVSPDGRYLAFMSRLSLTGYDNRDAASGQPDQEVYLYDSAAAPGRALVCASCNPTGARPHGLQGATVINSPPRLVDGPGLWRSDEPAPSRGTWLAADIPGWTSLDTVHALYQSRYLSNSGRLFFNAADALVPQDSNGTFDVYEFEFPQGPGQPASDNCTTASPTYGTASGGCVSLISSGTSPEESAFLDASESGDDVFFLTASKLAPTDVDSALDIYDARVGGSPTQPAKPVECSGDACQQPAVPPSHPTPGTVLLNGPGNVFECPKGKVKQKGKCVKRQTAKKHKKGKHKKSDKNKHKKQGKKQKKDQRAAGHKRGGQK